MDENKFYNYSITNYDKNHVWTFCAGQYSQDFRGNPKYLFLYISKFRPDIYAYWLCDDEKIIEQIQSMGLIAFKMGSSRAAEAIERTGVLVAEQVKAEIPRGLEKAKYVNLWHGVGGVKVVERSIKEGLLVPELAKKYIRHNEYYRTYQLYLAPSGFIESIAREQLGLEENQIIRAGYPRNIFQSQYERIVTYNHDIIKERELPKDTKIAVYIPTRREFSDPNFFLKAFPDMGRLIELLERKHILLIFKMHPYFEKDRVFLHSKEMYKDCPWLLFWDNSNDYYEIIDKTDLCIMDYSSMYTDFIISGCKHFIRYCFDFDDRDLDFPLGYDETTLGEKCNTFDELIAAIDSYDKRNYKKEIDKIKKLYWEYDHKNSLDTIVDRVLSFEPKTPELPTLYSFDIFDTVFSRKVLDPVGIFFAVKEKMEEVGGFEKALVKNYPEIRRNTELIVREFYKKSTDIRSSEKLEIHFDDIFARLSAVYNLTQDQIELLKRWEMEFEIENVIPLSEQIDLIKKYISQGDTVILISDMYLPKDFVVKMLEKADPILAKLPIYLSNEYGVLKAHQTLYYEVYNSFRPFYDFKKWIHYGDNQAVDQTAARKCGINTRLIKRPVFSDVQNALVEKIGTYDSYLVAAIQARLCETMFSEKEKLVASYVTLLMVPYIDWVLHDAVRRGYETLYFVSRDGHPLKRIADSIIEERKLNIKTKYIFASRRTWRIPSFIDEVDPCFWQSYANFGDLVSKQKLFKAMSLDEESFNILFPDINPDEIDFKDKKYIIDLIERFKTSEEYNDYLMFLAAEEREIVSGYLKQEIEANERFAVVEYWGRGYTQDTMVRLWQDIVGKKVDVPFYYTRTVLPSIGNSVRYNFTTNAAEQFFIEGFFANMPYKSVERYDLRDGRIEPVIEEISYNREIYEAMQYALPEFAKQYARLDFKSRSDISHMLYDFALNYYLENRESPVFAEFIGSMIDSVATYGKKREFAPPITDDILKEFSDKKILRGDSKLTTSITMSIIRSEEKIREKYFKLYQILPGDNLVSGRPLTKKEQEDNENYKSQYNTLLNRAEKFKKLYDEAVDKTEISKKIIFVVNGKSLSDVDLSDVFAQVECQTFYENEVLLLGNYKKAEDKDIALKLASAKFIIIGNPIHLFTHTQWRKETELILLKNVPFSLYNTGLTQYKFLKWEKKLVELKSKNDISVMQVPSKSSENLFKKCFGGSIKVKSSLYGSCVTDCYFDKNFKKTAAEKLSRIFPAVKNKKIILYMPFFRLKPGFSKWIQMLDMMHLRKALGNEYFIIINFNKKIKSDDYDNIVRIDGFCNVIDAGSETLSIRELICASDIIVGDYRDSFFESALLKKPVYSMAWDYEEIIKSPNMTNNAKQFESFLFGPVIKNSSDLVEELNRIEDYDFYKMENFAKEHFEYCDGKSSERVVSYLNDKYCYTPKEQDINEEWHKKFLKLEQVGENFASLYNKMIKKTKSSKKILFISTKNTLKDTGIGLLYNKLIKQYDDVKIITISQEIQNNKGLLEETAKEIAGAGFIIANESIPLFCKIKFRQETRVILIKDVAYPLYNRSLAKQYKYTWQSKYEKLKTTVNFTDMQIPALSQRDAYINKYCNGDQSVKTELIGNCLSDIYFNKTFAKKAKEKVLNKYPLLKDKKIILFIPTVGEIQGTQRDKLPLDLMKLKEELPEDFSVLLNLNKNQKKKLKEDIKLPNGYYEIESGFTAKELMVSCDVVVGDYRDTLFEAAITNIPCFSTAYDFEKVILASKGGLSREEFNEVMFMPLAKSEKELSDYIKKIDEYDYKAMNTFKRKYLSGCKGKSVKAMLDMLLPNED